MYLYVMPGLSVKILTKILTLSVKSFFFLFFCQGKTSNLKTAQGDYLSAGNFSSQETFLCFFCFCEHLVFGRLEVIN